MKITNLNIENFMAIGSADLDLDSRGLVLIQGKNLDDKSAISNGAGKSSIPDALSWCLYGVTARGETGDKIINNEARSAAVEMTINMDDGSVYRICRYRKHKTFKSRLLVHKLTDEGVVELTLGTDKETQVLVNTIIGCDEKVFNAAIYQGQEEIPDLPKFTDKQLKELVEETAGITVLQECYTLARNKANTLKKEFDSLMDSLGISEEVKTRYEGDLATVEAQMKSWVVEQKNRIEAADDAYEEAKDEHAAAEVKVKSAEEKLPAINKNVKVLEETLAAEKEHVARQNGLRQAAAEAGRKPTLLRSEISRLEGDIRKFEHKLKGVASRVGTACGECGKSIEEADLTSVQAGIKEGIRDKGAEIKVVSKKLEAAVVTEQEAIEEYEGYEMPDYTEANAKLRKCYLAIDKIEAAQTGLRKLKNEMDRRLERHAELEAEKNPHTVIHERMKKNLAGATKTCKEINKKGKKCKTDLALAEKVVKVYGPAGVRAHILDHVAPFLNSRTGHYLSALSDGNLKATWQTLSKTAKGELREKFSIEVENATGGKSFGLLSGGEKRKVRLACAMALQDVVSQRASKPIELFMADEIDDALDEAGLERLMAILDEKARERGTVLVISHRSLSDWIREVATVTKEGGSAKITGALSA